MGCSTAFMPIYILAARVCPPVSLPTLNVCLQPQGLLRCWSTPGRLQGVEASLYAGLMSVSNAGQNASSALIALVSHLVGVTSTSFGNTWVLIIAAQVLAVRLCACTLHSCQCAAAHNDQAKQMLLSCCHSCGHGAGHA